MSTTTQPAWDYTAEEIKTAKATRCTYVGSISFRIGSGRRVVVFTRNTVQHARDVATKALTMPGYRARMVSILPDATAE